MNRILLRADDLVTGCCCRTFCRTRTFALTEFSLRRWSSTCSRSVLWCSLRS